MLVAFHHVMKKFEIGVWKNALLTQLLCLDDSSQCLQFAICHYHDAQSQSSLISSVILSPLSAPLHHHCFTCTDCLSSCPHDPSRSFCSFALQWTLSLISFWVRLLTAFPCFIFEPLVAYFCFTFILGSLKAHFGVSCHQFWVCLSQFWVCPF